MQEIERKFRVLSLPFDVEKYPHYTIEQGYICTDPVLRVRMSGELEDKGQVLREAHCTLCYKSSGLMSHREESFPINVDQFQRLKEKAEGVLEKTDIDEKIAAGFAGLKDKITDVFKKNG